MYLTRSKSLIRELIEQSETNILSGAQKMALHELTRLLHRNDMITPPVIDAIEHHAAALSQDICDDFKALNAIILRHEALIGFRWRKKTVSERQKLIINAWPNMPRHHRPDTMERFQRNLQSAKGTIPDQLVWPFSTSPL